MKEFFSQSKQDISGCLNSYVKKNSETFSRMNDDSPAYLEDIAEFSSRGKMIRGGLVFLAWSLYRDDRPDFLAAAGASMELMQSALLIHDDIMDHDEIRRGKPSLYFKYAENGRKKNFHDSAHLGESLGICSGDLSFFMGYEILADYRLDCDYRALTSLMSRELAYVCLAQMKDVENGHNPDTPPLDTVLNLYRYKTGRYTFSLPLMTGALLAGQDSAVLDYWAVWGEEMGILFQLQDDLLGLFARAEDLGKPLGSDFLEGKMTPLSLLMLERVPEGDVRFIRELTSRSSLTREELERLQFLAVEYGVKKDLEARCSEIASRLKADLDSLECRREGRKILEKFIDYNLKRIN